MAAAKVVSGALVVLALVIGAPWAQAQTRYPIAFVSVQRVMKEAAAPKAALAELSALQAAHTADLSARRTALLAVRAELAKASGYFSIWRRVRLEGQVRKQEAELQDAIQQAQKNLEERQRKLDETLRTELERAVIAIAAEQGIQYVLNQETAVLVAPRGADLTAEVIARLNAAPVTRAVGKK